MEIITAYLILGLVWFFIIAPVMILDINKGYLTHVKEGAYLSGIISIIIVGILAVKWTYTIILG